MESFPVGYGVGSEERGNLLTLARPEPQQRPSELLGPRGQAMGASHARGIERRNNEMSLARNKTFILAAATFLFAFVAIALLSTSASAAPEPSQIFIDQVGDRTYNATADGPLYLHIQEAIDAAANYSDIVVGKGDYTEQLSINKTLNLIGGLNGTSRVIAPDPMSTGGVLVSITGGPTVSLTGFEFMGPAANFKTGVLVLEGSTAVILNDNFVAMRNSSDSFDPAPFAIRVGYWVDESNGVAAIDNCTFSDFGAGAIAVDWVGSFASITDNAIAGSGTAVGDGLGQQGVFVWNSASANVMNNVITNMGGAGHGMGILIFNGAHDVSISDNIIVGLNIGTPIGSPDSYTGIFLTGTGNVLGMGGSLDLVNVIATGNTVREIQDGFAVTDTEGGVMLIGNTISANNCRGVHIVLASDIKILSNEIVSNGAFGIEADLTGSGIVATDNNIVHNPDGGLANTGAGVIEASLNWWGNVSGPGGDAPGAGDGVVLSLSGNIAYKPWLKYPFPPEVIISGNGDVGQVSASTPFESAAANVTVLMTGAGTHILGALMYDSNPGVAMLGQDMMRYIDVHIRDPAGVTELEIRLHYTSADIPIGIAEAELRMYWWNNQTWQACTDTGVNLVDQYIWVKVRADTVPSLADITGTPFAGGSPLVEATPLTGPEGSLVTITGQGFTPDRAVTIWFGDNLIGYGRTDAVGNLTDLTGVFASIQVHIPESVLGDNRLRVMDEDGVFADNVFSVTDETPVIITADVGALHFRGEIVSFYVLTTWKGIPVNVTGGQSTLYLPNGTTVPSLMGTNLGTGLYLFQYAIPVDAPAGEYTLLLTATFQDAAGATLKTFEVNPTLTDWGARLTAIEGNIATIQTDIGSILVNITEINAHLASIDGSIAVIETDIGVITADVADINATLAAIQGTQVVIQTDIGSITENISAINGRLVSIEDDVATIETTLGTIQENISAINGRLDSIEGDVATIATDVGDIQVNVSAINASLVTIDGNIAQIHTDIGVIMVNVSNIAVRLSAIEGNLAVLTSDVGSCKENLTAINAKIDAINGTLVTVRSNVGALTVSLAALDARVVSIQDGMVVITTNLQTLRGNVTALEGSVATIQTDLGQAKLDISNLQDKQTSSIGTNTLAFVVIGAVLVILVGLYAWRLRKM
jgi:parallel beta-helix repeat protein